MVPAARVAIANAGTIPDRGLYGVFLETGEAGGGKQRRVGELDEEMVFESREGDVFVLGASSWRIEEITEDKVIVTPAPGEPGKMPFWHGDRPGRPLDHGRGAPSRAGSRARGGDDVDGRRHGVPRAGIRRASGSRAVLSPRGRSRGSGGPGARHHLLVRRALPRERCAGAALAAPPSRPPQSALGTAEARARPPASRLPLRKLPLAPGDLPRVPARRLRSAGAAGDAAAAAGSAAARGVRRLAHSLAVRRLPALQLRRELHLRRRYAARPAPRPGALGRPGPAAGVARRGPDARTARPAIHRGG